MTVAQIADGSQTAVISTTHTLDTETGEKTYVLCVDLSNMASGDVMELTAWTKTRSSSTSAISYSQSFTGAQAETAFISIPVPSVHEIVFKLEQTAGTGRAFPWSVLTLD